MIWFCEEKLGLNCFFFLKLAGLNSICCNLDLWYDNVIILEEKCFIFLRRYII